MFTRAFVICAIDISSRDRVIKEANALVPETEVGVEGAATVPVRLGVPGERSRKLVDNKEEDKSLR